MFAVKTVDHSVRSGRKLSGVLGSLRVQLFLCILIGLAVPALIYTGGELSILAVNVSARNSLLAATIATIAGLVAVQRLGEFPGSIGASYIFPAMAGAYSIAVVVILLSRAPYSGVLLSVAIASSLTVRFAIGALERRSDESFYYLVPGGHIDRIRQDIGVAFITLTKPVLPTQPGGIIVADLHHDHSPEWERMFAAAALNGIGVYHYKQIWEARTGMVRIEHLSENSLGSLIPSNSYSKVKRLIDIMLTLLALPVLIIPLALTALLIRGDSPGPAFFRQERIGHRGKAFSVLKFRTMRVANPSSEADHVDEAITKEGDDRITKIGRFLRKTRIDELPQIYNVLRGEMSWIGPRPEACAQSEWYEQEIPFYSYRHIVRPGITGWAQVNQGHVAGISDVHNKLRLDFYYIKNFSMWIDLVILFKTVIVVIKGSGAK